MFHSKFFKYAAFIGSLSIVTTISASADVSQGVQALNDKKYDEAATLFSEAYEQGDANGAFYLARMLELGLGGQRNIQAAVGLYIAGSAKGSPLSKNRLGVMHIQGFGVLQDYERGAELVCEAAEADDINGQFNCASLLQEGKGLPKDIKKSIEWFGKAADGGHVGAKNLYADALVKGEFIQRDLVKAVKLYEETAASGNPLGLYSLALAYENGLGVEADVKKAHAYFNLAATLNHPLAPEGRARIEKDMTPEQISEAQRFAKEWRPVQINSETENASNGKK